MKASSFEELLAECDCVGLEFSPENEEALRAALEDARRLLRDSSLPFWDPEGPDGQPARRAATLLAGWDAADERYYLAVKGMYDPRNLLQILYERLVGERGGAAERETEDAASLIDAYLGVIEEKERISLAAAREKLTELAVDMWRTLDVYEDDEYSEEELERLCDTLTKAYFDPLRELLEGVIVAIAGNKA